MINPDDTFLDIDITLGYIDPTFGTKERVENVPKIHVHFPISLSLLRDAIEAYPKNANIADFIGRSISASMFDLFRRENQWSRIFKDQASGDGR